MSCFNFDSRRGDPCINKFNHFNDIYAYGPGCRSSVRCFAPLRAVRCPCGLPTGTTRSQLRRCARGPRPRARRRGLPAAHRWARLERLLMSELAASRPARLIRARRRITRTRRPKVARVHSVRAAEPRRRRRGTCGARRRRGEGFAALRRVNAYIASIDALREPGRSRRGGGGWRRRPRRH